MDLSFRNAQRCDAELLFGLIKQLAVYEKMENEVLATPELLTEWLFDRQKAEVVFPVLNGKEIGYTLFFHSFSTFLGRSGIYLEDIFILPEYRGRGYGKATFKMLAQTAVNRGCGRLEWACLDWNRPSIDFYLSLGAKPLNGWTVYRLTDDNLKKIAEQNACADN